MSGASTGISITVSCNAQSDPLNEGAKGANYSVVSSISGEFAGRLGHLPAE
jgi:hypothetical protein